MFLRNRKRINLTIQKKKWFIQHTEENEKLSRVKIALDCSTGPLLLSMSLRQSIKKLRF